MNESTMLAEIAYESYRLKHAQMGTDINRLCTFAGLRDDHREAWEYAACAVAEAVTGCVKGQ